MTHFNVAGGAFGRPCWSAFKCFIGLLIANVQNVINKPRVVFLVNCPVTYADYLLRNQLDG